MAENKKNIRELALDILISVGKGEEYSHILIRNVLDKYDYMDSKDKAFLKRLTEGCLERRIELDYIIDGFSKITVKKMKPLIRELLRMSTYQLLYMTKVPQSAVINEAVKLAKKRGFQSLSGFVNAVLRNIAREGGDYPLPDAQKQPERYLSVKYSMPEWMIAHWRRDYGETVLEPVLQGLLEIRPVTVRLSASESSEEKQKLLETMKAGGVAITPHPYHKEAFLLTGLEGIRALPGYDEGRFTVQDVSSMLAVEAAGIKPGDYCLDICAAPGGKTAYAAMQLKGTGRVVSADVSEYKTAMIEETVERLKLSNVEIKVRDARISAKEEEQPGDVVLADVPCLGLGVMGKKRDIKYRVEEKDLEEIVKLQREILTAAVTFVKPGGVLLYSTCSMTVEENQENVRFMEEALGLKRESLEPYLPQEFLDCLIREEDWQSIRAGYLQLLPGIHQTDGFFFARMVKQNG